MAILLMLYPEIHKETHTAEVWVFKESTIVHPDCICCRQVFGGTKFYQLLKQMNRQLL